MQKKWREITSRNLNATNGPFFFLRWGRTGSATAKNNHSRDWLAILIVYIKGDQTVEHLCCIITESNVRAAVIAVMDSIIWLLLDKLHETLVLETQTRLSHGNLWLNEWKQYLLTPSSTAAWGSVNIYCSKWVWTQKIRNAVCLKISLSFDHDRLYSWL